MVSSQLNRLILVAFLPVIALTLYLEGQSYDPQLIRFVPSEMTARAEADFFPGQAGGFHRAGQVRHYSEENLYEYVNGHAEYFLSAGFSGLAVGEYVLAGTEPAQPDIVVDIYDMGKTIHAFGVFADETGDNPARIQVGMMGARTERGISFVNGKYYVKISSFQDELMIDDFAVRIDEIIGSSGESIKAFSRLPQIEEVVATRFVKEAYRGLDFVNNVVEREYLIGGKSVQISLVSGGEDETRGLESSYLSFLEDTETPFEEQSRSGYRVFRVSDPYEGLWYLLVSSDAIFGIYGDLDDTVLDEILSSVRRTDQDESG
jgi:hypothetical protein